ncbi:SPOR domain-containing protein [Halioxenophilus sp. WMMB6]|uniref:SPOR domain-containing protein n=1 Tax=Halioxenophilus sp. WMMB6 TaxID=3073815 RepID=UPI00295EB87E|nr:SPOR domain-containing protein [Halioxenophilus sp. WMMB6]
MDSGVKQRIIGACVLTAIGVIFLPSLLQRKEDQLVDTNTQIPPMPEFTLYPHEKPQPPVDIAEPPTQDQVFLAESEPEPTSVTPPPPTSSSTTSSPAANSPAPSSSTASSPSPTVITAKRPVADNNAVLSDQGLPISWVVQVASFKDQERANAMVTKLLSQDFRAYSREASYQGQAIYRVYVGPSIEREDAESIKKKLDKALNANTLVLKLSP